MQCRFLKKRLQKNIIIIGRLLPIFAYLQNINLAAILKNISRKQKFSYVLFCKRKMQEGPPFNVFSIRYIFRFTNSGHIIWDNMYMKDYLKCVREIQGGMDFGLKQLVETKVVLKNLSLTAEGSRNVMGLTLQRR